MGLTSKDADPQGKRYLVKTLECYARAGFGFIFALDADCADNKNVLIAQHKLAHQLKLFKAPLYSATGFGQWQRVRAWMITSRITAQIASSVR
jgi:putative DNA primase/helicase